MSLPPTTHLSPLLNKLFFRLNMISTCLIAAFSIDRIKNLPIDFCNIFVKLSQSHVHTRRSKYEFYLNSVRLDVCTRFITFAGVQI